MELEANYSLHLTEEEFLSLRLDLDKIDLSKCPFLKKVKDFLQKLEELND